MVTKQDLLDHYDRLDGPVPFLQYDGFVQMWGDSVAQCDSDGDALFWGTTYELMSGGVPVRILVSERASAEDVIRILRKVAHLIKEVGLQSGEVDPDDLPF